MKSISQEKTIVAPVDFPPAAETSSTDAVVRPDSPILADIKVSIEARLGHGTITVNELLRLRIGSVVPLDAKLGGLVLLRLNEVNIAKGEIVAVGDNFGVRIVEILGAK